MTSQKLARCGYAVLRWHLSASGDLKARAASEASAALFSAADIRCTHSAACCRLQRSSAALGSDPQHLIRENGPSRLKTTLDGALTRYHCPQGGVRAFSAASSKAASDVGPQNEGRTGGIEGIVLKTLIIGTILAVALKLGPHIALGNVNHAVRLLDAETPFMQKSGAKRIKRLAGIAGNELRKENAPAKLLGLLHEGTDPGVSMAIIEALEAICKEYEGTEAVIRAGGTDVLQEAVDHGWLMDVLARELAASLLVGLKIQQGHLD